MKEKLCKQCGRIVYGYGDTCGTCLMHPKSEHPKSEQPKTEVPVANHDKKQCIDCQQDFIATGNRQDRCEKCAENHERAKKREYQARWLAKKSGKPVTPRKPDSIKIMSESASFPKEVFKNIIPMENARSIKTPASYEPATITIEIGSVKITISK